MKEEVPIMDKTLPKILIHAHVAILVSFIKLTSKSNSVYICMNDEWYTALRR